MLTQSALIYTLELATMQLLQQNRSFTGCSASTLQLLQQMILFAALLA
ncbi:hypothetical protein [Paenibacillus sp. LPE1-1-1.1]